MLGWIGPLLGLSKAGTLATASSVLDLRVTQVANQTWGVHALLPGRDQDRRPIRPAAVEPSADVLRFNA